MVYTILNSYWERFHKDKKKSIIQVIRKMDKFEKILFVIALISATLGIVTDTLFAFGIWRERLCVILLLVGIIVEGISVIIMCNYTMKRDVKQAIKKVSEIKLQYAEVHDWLKKLEHSSKAEIKQLSYRCEKELEAWENEKKENVKNVEKVLTAFYVPVLLTIISGILGDNQITDDKAKYIVLAFLMITLGVLIYLLIIAGYKVVEKYIYSYANKMKYMIKDLHGVMDYCFISESDDIEILYLGKNDK